MTTLWSSKVEHRITKLIIIMFYRIYKRLRPRQCRQFSNVHGYHSKSTFRAGVILGGDRGEIFALYVKSSP